MNGEIAVVAYSSTQEGPLCAFDVATGALLTQFKTNQSPANGLIPLGSDHFVAAQPSRRMVHVYTWHKDALEVKGYAPEPVRPLAATKDGRYIFGGSASGTVFAWEASKGTLIAKLHAHYKAVTALSLSDDGSLLISGGEDSLVHVWEVYTVLERRAETAAHDPPRPLHTWSEHVLPISALVCGSGGAHALALSASLDGKLLVWNLARGTLLKAFTLPAQALCCALDPAELSAFVGCSDGRLYEAPLTSASPEEIRGLPPSSSSRPATLTSAPFSVLDAQPRDITSLAISPLGTALLAGSSDGNVRVYDLESRQCVRTLKAPMGAGGVSGLFVVPTPAYLHSGAGLLVASTAGNAGAAVLPSAASALPSQPQFAGHAAEVLQRHGPKRGQPVAMLQVHDVAPERPWEGPLVVLEGSALPAVPAALRTGLAAPALAVQQNLLGQTAAPDLVDCSASYMVDSGAAVLLGVQQRGAASAPGTAGARGDPIPVEAGTVGGSGSGSGDLSAQVARLQKELEAATESAKIWKELHEGLMAKMEGKGAEGAGAGRGRPSKKAKQ